VRCVGQPGVVPAAEYHPAHGSGEWGSDAGIYFTARRAQDEVHELQYPLARGSADMVHLFRGIAAAWR
jgi:hypothetical protein